jgi:AraC family transcriptional regulator
MSCRLATSPDDADRRATGSTPSRGHLTLPFGAFYGTVDRRLRAPGMELAMLNVDPHRVVERHSHDDAHFVFVLDGLYVSSASGAPPVSAGRALIFNPAGTTHRDRFEARDRVLAGQFLTLSIANDLMDATRDEAHVAPRAVALRSPEALALAERLVAACVSRSSDATLRRESLVLALLAQVSTSRVTDTRDAPAWLAIARARLDEALGTEISIGEVAREAGVHPVHLARVFRKFVGISPAEYLRQRRLAHARALLCETRRPLSDIALTCGFVDQPHFSTAFRRAYGVTPLAYRTR